MKETSDQRNLLHQAGVFGLQPKESENRPPESESNRFGVSVVELEEEKNFSEGKFVRVEKKEKVVVPFAVDHWKASAAEENSENKSR